MPDMSPIYSPERLSKKGLRWFNSDESGDSCGDSIVDAWADVLLFSYAEDYWSDGPVIVDDEQLLDNDGYWDDYYADGSGYFDMGDAVLDGVIRIYPSLSAAFAKEGGCPFTSYELVQGDDPSDWVYGFDGAEDQALEAMEGKTPEEDLPDNWDELDYSDKVIWFEENKPDEWEDEFAFYEDQALGFQLSAGYQKRAEKLFRDYQWYMEDVEIDQNLVEAATTIEEKYRPMLREARKNGIEWDQALAFAGNWDKALKAYEHGVPVADIFA